MAVKIGDRVIVIDDGSSDSFIGKVGTLIDPEADPRVKEEWPTFEPKHTNDGHLWIHLDDATSSHTWQLPVERYEVIFEAPEPDEIEAAIQSIKEAR